LRSSAATPRGAPKAASRCIGCTTPPIPERDPENNPEWKAAERKLYTSEASWQREQEIIDEAGGGELVFADTLLNYWDKIVISAPEWRPDPKWRVEAGFDHGKTNPTALLRCYIDYAGTIIFAGEYYQPGKEIWEHVPVMREMTDVRKIAACYADPTIFDCNLQQSANGRPQERAKSFNELYVEQGIGLFSPFAMDRSDVSFAGRLNLHWANLEERAAHGEDCLPQLRREAAARSAQLGLPEPAVGTHAHAAGEADCAAAAFPQRGGSHRR
jgi:hypothetical protein